MAKQIINLGTQGTQSGDTVRTAFDKSNDNFDELYGAVQCVHYGDQQGLSYSTSSTSYQTGSNLISSLPAGTYLCFFTLLGSTTIDDTTGYCKLKMASGDVGIALKWSKRGQGSLDTGNFWYTSVRVVTIGTAGAVYPQYKLLSGTGSISISGLQVAFMKIA